MLDIAGGGVVESASDVEVDAGQLSYAAGAGAYRLVRQLALPPKGGLAPHHALASLGHSVARDLGAL
jgi:hypothetical protein